MVNEKSEIRFPLSLGFVVHLVSFFVCKNSNLTLKSYSGNIMFHNEFLFYCKKMYFSRDEHLVIKIECLLKIFHKTFTSNPFPLK